MGSATTQATVATVDALAAAGGVTLDDSRELFDAAHALSDSPQLASALADAAAPEQARTQLVATVFGGLGETSRSLLTTAVQQRWSSPADLVDGVEELAVRAASIAAASADVEGELFGVSRLVAANPSLELALGSRLGESAKKGELVESLLRGKVSEATILIASRVIQQPRERRVRQLLSRAERLVSQQRGRAVATVYSATTLTEEQTERLRRSLAARTGRDVSLNLVVEPTVIGGIRVEVGDDVIDATVSSRLGELRQRLAG